MLSSTTVLTYWRPLRCATYTTAGYLTPRQTQSSSDSAPCNLGQKRYKALGLFGSSTNVWAIAGQTLETGNPAVSRKEVIIKHSFVRPGRAPNVQFYMDFVKDYVKYICRAGHWIPTSLEKYLDRYSLSQPVRRFATTARSPSGHATSSRFDMYSSCCMSIDCSIICCVVWWRRMMWLVQ